MKQLRGKLERARSAAAKPRPRASPHTHLSPEERALWSHVAGSIDPIKAKSRIPRPGIEPVDTANAAASPSRAHGGSHLHDTPRPRTPAPTQTIVSAAKAAIIAPLADFDARKARKIAKGRTAIEARLDLHGLRQDEAHHRLRRFLRDCHGQGLKHVLVITGKGRESAETTTPFGDMFDRNPRGVLRRNVPRWLAEPELRPLIVSYTTATQRHGGNGAFYIELRRVK